MHHLLHWLLRLSVPDDDRQAILGDLEEEYRSRVQRRSWASAQVWYFGQVIAAAWAYTTASLAVTPDDARSLWRPLPTGDVRDALRRWRRRPGFPVAAAVTLGLGIGAATAMRGP